MDASHGVFVVGQRDPVAYLAPYAEQFDRRDARPISPRANSLQGARIGFVENGFASIAIVYDELRSLLAADDIASVGVRKRKFGDPLDQDQLDKLMHGTDVVIVGLSNTPPSTSWGVHDCVELERLGKPTVILATRYYEALLEESAMAEGMVDLRRVVLPYPFEGLAEDRIRALTRLAAPAIVAALTSADSPTTASIDESGGSDDR